MLNNKSISNSKFSTISIVHNDTTCWATCSWWLSVILSSTTLASMNKELTSAAHLAWSLRFEIESAWSLCCLMHNILAPSDFINCCWKWTCVHNTLVIRIQISFSLATISHCVDCPFSRSTSKSACVLIKVISLSCSSWQWFATISCTRLISKKRVSFLSLKWLLAVDQADT